MKLVYLLVLASIVFFVWAGFVYNPSISKTEIELKQWTPADLYDLQCLREEIPSLQRVISNKDGKWNIKMIRLCEIELCQKEASLEALHKKYL